MKTLKYLFILLFMVSSLFSCDDYLDINDDPDAPANVSLDLRLKPTIRLANGAAQWRGTREVAVVMQYVVSKYSFYDTWDFSSSYYFWQNALVWTYPNAIDLIVMGEDQNSPHFTGVGKIFKSFLLISLSDQFGSMPWDDLYDGRNNPSLTPKFVEQKIIYENCINLLDEAIADLSSTDNALPLNNRDGDILYQGDTDKWIRFAYALKARYLNHYSKKSAIYDPDAVIEACNNAFTSEDMDAEFNYSLDGSSTQANPLSEEGYGGMDASTPRYKSFSNFFVNLMKASPLTDDGVDPRLSIIMNPAENTGEFAGIVSGMGGEAADLGDYSRVPGGFYSKGDSPFPFITYSEIKLIEAEAKLRKGDNGGAKTAFKEGVLSNMRKLNVDGAIIDETALKIDALSFASLQSGLGFIMPQKYITLAFNPESWVDLRRMDYSSEIYPGLVRPVNLPGFYGDDKWIRSMCYEKNEENRNGDNLPDNRPEVKLIAPVWWDIEE